MYPIKSRGETASKLTTIAIGLLIWFPPAVNAQTSIGTPTTTCRQTGTEMVCTTEVKYTLPSGVSLQQNNNVGTGNFVLAPSGGPGCGQLTAQPQSVSLGQQTRIDLTLGGCVGGTTYTWDLPAVQSPNTQTPHQATHLTLTLTAANAKQTYRVKACASTALSSCVDYSVDVGVTQTTQPLTGCKVNPASSTITTADSKLLSVSCDTGASNPTVDGVTWQWRKDGINVPANGNTSSYTVPVGTAQGGPYYYTVSMTNNASATAVISVAGAVTVNAVVANSCPGNVSVPSRVIAAGSTYESWKSSGHPGSTPYVVAIDVPANASSFPDAQGVISFAQYSGPGAREYTLSRTPCDFTVPVRTYGYDLVFLNYDAARYVTEPHSYLLSEGRWYLNLRSVPGVCGATQTCSMSMQSAP